MTLPNPSSQPESMTDSQKRLIMSLALNDLQTKVSKHENILLIGSDSHLPLVERVRNLESYINNTKYWTRFVAGALVIQTLSFGGAVIWAAIRLLPLLERLANQP